MSPTVTQASGVGLNARRMPDLAYHMLGCLRVSTRRELLIQRIQGNYCDKSCTNEFHGPPRDSRGER
jgi:hypothetical protein